MSGCRASSPCCVTSHTGAQDEDIYLKSWCSSIYKLKVCKDQTLQQVFAHDGGGWEPKVSGTENPQRWVNERGQTEKAASQTVRKQVHVWDVTGSSNSADISVNNLTTGDEHASEEETGVRTVLPLEFNAMKSNTIQVTENKLERVKRDRSEGWEKCPLWELRMCPSKRWPLVII